MGLLNPEMAEWDRRTAFATEEVSDSAAPGSNARQAALRRQLLAEIATWNNKLCFQILWDIQAYYDAMRLEELIAAAKEADFPPGIIYVACCLHMAPARSSPTARSASRSRRWPAPSSWGASRRRASLGLCSCSR